MAGKVSSEAATMTMWTRPEVLAEKYMSGRYRC